MPCDYKENCQPWHQIRKLVLCIWLTFFSNKLIVNPEPCCLFLTGQHTTRLEVGIFFWENPKIPTQNILAALIYNFPLHRLSYIEGWGLKCAFKIVDSIFINILSINVVFLIQSFKGRVQRPKLEGWKKSKLEGPIFVPRGAVINADGQIVMTPSFYFQWRLASSSFY